MDILSFFTSIITPIAKVLGVVLLTIFIIGVFLIALQFILVFLGHILLKRFPRTAILLYLIAIVMAILEILSIVLASTGLATISLILLSLAIKIAKKR